MNQTYSELRKVNLILISIQARLDKELLRETRNRDNPEVLGRPNNGILKEYNGEPKSSKVTPLFRDFELETYQTISRLIEEQISRISLTLDKLESLKDRI